MSIRRSPSFDLVNAVIEVSGKRLLTSAEFRVLILLALHANDDGIAYVASRTLAAETGSDRRAVWRCIDSLVAKGFVAVLNGADRNAGLRTPTGSFPTCRKR